MALSLVAAKHEPFLIDGGVQLGFRSLTYVCPSRFFAGVENELASIYLLEDYKIRLPEGIGRQAGLVYADAKAPDPSKPVAVRTLVKD
jgi:hypothetical protein